MISTKIFTEEEMMGGDNVYFLKINWQYDKSIIISIIII